MASLPPPYPGMLVRVARLSSARLSSTTTIDPPLLTDATHDLTGLLEYLPLQRVRE